MADDISRRIDDLLSGAIDEQVREQRALNDTMIGVRDGVSRLVGDVAALSARVTEARETSQGLREELPFLVQREVSSAVNAMSVRIDVLETAVGELVASLAGLEDRVGPDVIIGGVTQRLEAMRAGQEEQAGEVTAQAAKDTIARAADDLAAAFDSAAKGMSEMVEKQHTQISRRLTDVKKWADDVDGRMRALEKALEANVKMPVEVRKQLNELTGATQDMTDSVLEEIRVNAESAAARISASVEGLDREAIEMNRRFAEMSEAMRTFQEQMLAYLQVRDVALEERRDQIVTELLAEFFNELPERERERTVGRLRSVFARRRDRRDAERYRTGPRQTDLPAVSPEAVARAQADIAREQRRAERPWAEPAPERPAPRTGRTSAPIFDDELDAEPAATDEPSDKPSAKKPAKGAKAAAAKKAPAKKAAAKKPAKKSAPKEAEPSSPWVDAVEPEPAADRPFEPAVPIATAAAGEIDVVDFRAFAEPEDAEGPDSEPASAPKKKAAAAKKKSSVAKPAAKKAAAKKKSAPEPGGDDTTPDAGEASESRAPAVADPVAHAGAAAEDEAEAGEDTLQQALARVQALVDQHRKPGGGRQKRS